MGKKKIPEVRGLMSEIRDKADEMLMAVGACELEVVNIEACIEEEMSKIRDRYAGDLAVLKEMKTDAEKALKKFALKNRVDLFGLDGDKVSLPHGIILYAKEDKVTIPKDAVEKIEGLGWSDGIIIVKNIDRPVIEKWNDEKLAAIGASKKPKENISWEIKKRAEG
jgi:phage host-nuclease inhibitor protein Gam